MLEIITIILLTIAIAFQVKIFIKLNKNASEEKTQIGNKEIELGKDDVIFLEMIGLQGHETVLNIKEELSSEMNHPHVVVLDGCDHAGFYIIKKKKIYHVQGNHRVSADPNTP